MGFLYLLKISLGKNCVETLAKTENHNAQKLQL